MSRYFAVGRNLWALTPVC